MNFGAALLALKDGLCMTRPAWWRGKGMWIKLQVPDANSKMTAPYIYVRTREEHLVPWVASQEDLLAEDWCECSEK